MRVGIDAGGTFTDVVWLADGVLGTAKVPSRPDSPADAVLDGLARVAGTPGLICHGTTVGTNAVLARHGGPASMLVTKGFRDVLELGRGERLELYALSPSRPVPLIPQDRIFEIDLRLSSDGRIISSPTDDEIADIAEKLMGSGAQAIAVGILHSAQHPEQELRLAETMRTLTGLTVFASSSLAAFPREYERWSLASLAAYLAPVLGKYVADLASRCPSALSLMSSSGGLISPSQASENPAACVLSGPAGGALAAISLGRERVLSLDMGGTSTDVTLLSGKLPRTREAEIDRLPLPLPTIDIHTIGAGGGSIAHIDTGGMLALGPTSAGADPGPACYGRGGPATLSDIALIAGRLLTDRFLGGEMHLSIDAARKALESVCPRGLGTDNLIDGILDLARVHLTGALRRISVARGVDPSLRSAPFTLVPFGGAGALFAVECARELGLKEILHPRAAGVFSAIGLLAAPIAREREVAILEAVDNARDSLLASRDKLTTELKNDLAEWGQDIDPVFTTTIDARYRGQTHSLEIPLPEPVDPDSLKLAFEAAYRARYAYIHPDARTEIVSIRVRAELPGEKVQLPDIETARRDLHSSNAGFTRVRIGREWIEAPVFERKILPIETVITGPALIVEDFDTLMLPPDSSMHLDRKGHAVIVIG
jgi:N-methylhydantoinase A